MNKKVADYLEDGCVFAEGDKCLDAEYGNICGGLWYNWTNMGDKLWNEDEVIKFTWRNSTGTPPTYTNLVEVKQRNGTVYVDYVKNIDFTLELSDNDVIQWKPYIECGLDWVLHKDRIFNKFGIISTSLYYNMMNNSIT